MTYARLKAHIAALEVLITSAACESAEAAANDNKYAAAKMQASEHQVLAEAIKEAQALVKDLKQREIEPPTRN